MNIKNKHPLYATWANMLSRCRNPTHSQYRDYGGRGIKVCDRWKEFDNFAKDMGTRPDGYTLERIDNDGNYEPGNCMWVSRTEQARNTRRNVVLTFNGMTKCIAEWSDATGLKRATIQSRLRRGWDVERVLTAPARDWGR